MQQEKNKTEIIIIKNLTIGDTEAFDQLFKAYANRLYLFSFKYLKSSEDAEEVVQDVFLKVWEKRKELNSGSSFKSYLYTIAFNLIKKRFLKNAKENAYKDEIAYTYLDSENNLEKIIDYKYLLKKVERIVDSMPPRRKEIFIKRKFYELPVKQIAEALKISPNTVENHLTAAQKDIKKHLGKEKLAGLIFFVLFIS